MHLPVSVSHPVALLFFPETLTPVNERSGRRTTFLPPLHTRKVSDSAREKAEEPNTFIHIVLCHLQQPCSCCSCWCFCSCYRFCDSTVDDVSVHVCVHVSFHMHDGEPSSNVATFFLCRLLNFSPCSRKVHSSDSRRPRFHLHAQPSSVRSYFSSSRSTFLRSPPVIKFKVPLAPLPAPTNFSHTCWCGEEGIWSNTRGLHALAAMLRQTMQQTHCSSTYPPCTAVPHTSPAAARYSRLF